MTNKQRKWLLASQEWYFRHALPWAAENKLPFGQPPVEYKKCLQWYKKAKRWHDRTFNGEVTTKEKPIPPPPPPPPGNPPA